MYEPAYQLNQDRSQPVGTELRSVWRDNLSGNDIMLQIVVSTKPVDTNAPPARVIAPNSWIQQSSECCVQVSQLRPFGDNSPQDSQDAGRSILKECEPRPKDPQDSPRCGVAFAERNSRGTDLQPQTARLSDTPPILLPRVSFPASADVSPCPRDSSLRLESEELRITFGRQECVLSPLVTHTSKDFTTETATIKRASSVSGILESLVSDEVRAREQFSQDVGDVSAETIRRADDLFRCIRDRHVDDAQESGRSPTSTPGRDLVHLLNTARAFTRAEAEFCASHGSPRRAVRRSRMRVLPVAASPSRLAERPGPASPREADDGDARISERRSTFKDLCASVAISDDEDAFSERPLVPRPSRMLAMLMQLNNRTLQDRANALEREKEHFARLDVEMRLRESLTRFVAESVRSIGKRVDALEKKFEKIGA